MDEGRNLGLKAEGTAIFESNPDWHESSDSERGPLGADYRKGTTPRGPRRGAMEPGETTAWVLGCLGRWLGGGRSCACAPAKSRFIKDRSEFHDRVWCFAATSQAAGKSAGGRATAIRRNGTSWVSMSPSTPKSPSHSAIWLRGRAEVGALRWRRG